MKRELNSRSRRKWVAGGVLVFGSVALLSTGFATWVIGASKTYADVENIGVIVDTINDESFVLSAAIKTPGDGIVIGDVTDLGTGFVQVENGTGDYEIVVTLTVEKGQDGAPTGTPTIVLDQTNNTISSSASGFLTTEVGRVANTDYTIFGGVTIAVDGSSEWALTASTTYEYKRDYKITFALGAVFNNAVNNAHGIADFYNIYYDVNSLTTKSAIDAAKEEIQGDLDAIIAVAGLGQKVTITLTE